MCDDYCCLEKGTEGKERIKLLLVYPKLGSEAKNVSLYPPLSVLYLASLLKDYSVAIFDQRVDPLHKFDVLLEQRPLCVGFSIMTGLQIKYALELAHVTKEKNIKNVFGGVHPTILPEQTQQDEAVDYVVVGEGEMAFRHIVEALERGNDIPPVVENRNVDLNALSSLPFDLVDVENYVHSAAIEGRALPIMFSRGCPFECTFCCNPVTTKRRWRAMNVDHAVSQMESLVDRYNLDAVIFWDENLPANVKTFQEIAKQINGKFNWFAQARPNSLLNHDLSFLEKMGARRFSCGIESGSPKILKKIKKEETVDEYIEFNRRIAKTNINVWYNYIIGFPDEEIEDLKLTVQLAVKILDENPRANNSTFALLVPYPGTFIADNELDWEQPDSLKGWVDFGRYNFSVDWYTPEMKTLYSRICFSSKFVGRRLTSLFPHDLDLKDLGARLTEKWRMFDFFNNSDWEELDKKSWNVLKKLFGNDAY